MARKATLPTSPLHAVKSHATTKPYRHFIKPSVHGFSSLEQLTLIRASRPTKLMSIWVIQKRDAPEHGRPFFLDATKVLKAIAGKDK